MKSDGWTLSHKQDKEYCQLFVQNKDCWRKNSSFVAFLRIRSLWQDFKEPYTDKSNFFSYQLCGQVCRPRFINTRISASFLHMQCSTLFFCLFWYSPKSFLVLYVVLCWFSQMVHKFLQKRGLLLLHFIIELGVHLDYSINYNILTTWNK